MSHGVKLFHVVAHLNDILLFLRTELEVYDSNGVSVCHHTVGSALCHLVILRVVSEYGAFVVHLVGR